MSSKFFIRYAKKADVPADRVAFYQPINPNEPDGPQIWSAFEPDPDGFALIKAGDLQRQLKEHETTSTRRNQQLQAYRKNKGDEKSELYSPDEIEQMVQQLAQLKEAAGKQVNVDDLRKQVHAELQAQFATKEKGHSTVLDTVRKELGWYRDQYKTGKRRGLASELMHYLPKPKPGLEEVALNLLMQEIDFEDVAPAEGKNPFIDYAPRMRGPNGFRLDSNTGQPIDPKAHVTGEFLRQYGQMFEPRTGTNGTGVQNSNNAPGGGGGGQGGQGGGKGKGSGKFTMKRSEVSQDAGAYGRMLKSVPSGDYLQIVDDVAGSPTNGQVIESMQGMARPAPA